MKKVGLFILLLMPVVLFSQCPKWIDEPEDSTLLLEKIAEKYIETPLQKKIDKTHRSDIDFTSKACSCEFFFTTTRIKRNKIKYKGVSQIVINGPNDKITKMYREYFYPLIKPCASSAKKTQLIYGDISVNYYLLNSKTAQISLHKQ